MATIADARPAQGRSMTGEEIKVITASSAGTIFEWYDFYLYGSLARWLKAGGAWSRDAGGHTILKDING